MTEAASPVALSEVTRAGDTAEESLESLKAFSRLLEESDRFSRLLEKTKKYRDMVPPYILEQVQEDYRKQKEQIDERLERQKDGFRKAYQEHLSEKEVLENICQKLRDRLKELRFRKVVGEYSDDEIQEECRDLKRQLADSLERLDRMEEILDQYVIIGFEELMDSEEAVPTAPTQTLEASPSEQEGEMSSTGDGSYLPTFEEKEDSDLQEPEADMADEPTREAWQGAAESSASSYPQGYLTILDGSRKGDRLPLIPADIMLGSSPNMDVMLTDQGISDSHARIFFRDRKYYIENLDVLGRTYVNGIQAKLSELNHNDVIRLGNLNLRVDFAPVKG